MPKLRVGLLFGGRSTEHEVSIASATSILGALDPARYEVRLIAVDPEGRWHLGTPALPPGASIDGPEVTLPAIPGIGALVSSSESAQASSSAESTPIDVLFPIIHGRGGEDGALQGLMELADVAYVGAGVLSSAVQMDKEVAKRLLRAAGIAVVPWVCVRGAELSPPQLAASAARAVSELGLPVFVKPSNSGSSVGTARAGSPPEVEAALADAARYDTKVLVEKAVDAREIEVAVIGNADPEASVPGEIRCAQEFYDYAAKYADDQGTELLIPAPLSEEESERIRGVAIEAYKVLDGEGLARVDFLLDRQSGELTINELNSLPGFTEGSMFPRLWEATGLPYPALIDRLIELALERHAQRSRLETTYRRG
ncbi:MAG: D-alanine--D-alanine ligase [Proteobacteria bacterium]|nr:D-alanine--D-alanine ligase [Pseudomonadota bacterium]